MSKLLMFLLILSFHSCTDGKMPLTGQTKWQKETNAMFKDASKSPLTSKDRKAFKGLSFFDFDSTYIVKANLERTPDSPYFKMKTTTNEVSEERVYGILTFDLNGLSHTLNVYQGKETQLIEGFEDYLFLPFLDLTNGDLTYGGGRYIDLRIPEGNILEIDFNKAYNPFCAYNARYSCPIVPRENFLNTEVKAGIKDYKPKD